MRRLLALPVLVLALAAPAAPAFGHAAYESSEPDNGSTVSSPPSRVIADFTERMTENSSLSVFDPCGTQVDHGDSLVANDRMTVSMSADKQGTYVVRFQAHSAVDGHLTTGEFSFTSTGGQPCPGSAEAEEQEEEEEEKAPGGGSGGDDSGQRSGTEGSDRDAGDGADVRSGDVRERGDDRRSVVRRRADNGTRAGSEASSSEDEAVAAPEDLELDPDPASIWDGIPIGDFLISLGVAALIGAAGGRIYAGIVGPRR